MFDSKKELLDKILLGESTFLELKEVRFKRGQVTGPSEPKLADELAAFANSRGGVLVLGVSDRPREVVGIPLDRLDSVVGFVRHVCTQLIEPTLNPIVDRLWLPSTTGEELGGRENRDQEESVRAPEPVGVPVSAGRREASHVPGLPGATVPATQPDADDPV